jgi:hypothetical protein
MVSSQVPPPFEMEQTLFAVAPPWRSTKQCTLLCIQGGGGKMSPLPQRCTLPAHEEATLSCVSRCDNNVIVAIAMAVAIAIIVAISVAATISITISHCRCHCPLCCHWPLAIAVAIAISIAITITIAVTVNHPCCHCRQPLPSAVAVTIAIDQHHRRCPCCRSLPSPLPSAITIAVAVSHRHHHWPLLSPPAITVAIAVASAISLENEEALIGELLPWRSDNYIQTNSANNAYLIIFFLDSERCTDHSR